ncbi:MAG: methyltransferase [Desulfobulbus sp.]|nr:methyltransferase [Desulfobulbus sp.]
MSETFSPASTFSEDSLFHGRLIFRQPKNGYRSSVDAVLAAHFAQPAAADRVLDLGCGCGVIGLILAHRYPGITVCGLELQKDLAQLAADNASRNGYNDRVQVQRGDVRAIAELLAPESFDLVVCNPPYRRQGSGRLNLDDQAARARHELHGDLVDFIRATAFAVCNRGRAVFVYPAQRSATLLAVLQAHRLTPRRLQPVVAYPQATKARLALVEAVKNGGEEFEILAPLPIDAAPNSGPSALMQAIYTEGPCSPE